MWWTKRDPRVTTALLLVLYFTHPMPALIACITLGVLWLFASRDWKQLLAFVPVTALMFWYYTTQTATAKRPDFSDLLGYVARGSYAMTFDPRQAYFGTALVIVYVVLAVATLLGRAPDVMPFGAVVLALVILYFIAPAAAAGGLGVNERILFFLMLIPIAWWTPELPERGKHALVAVMSIVAVANTAFLTMHYRQADRVIREIARTFDLTPENATFLPLVFDKRPPYAMYEYLVHSHDYAAVDNRLIDLTNYEAELGYFPIRYRPGYPLIYSSTIHPESFNATDYADRADLIFAWKMPRQSPIETRLNERYTLMTQYGLGLLYKRK